MGGALRGTASLVIPSELPAAVVGGHAPRGSGPASEAGGPLGIRVQPERPSVACILWAVERLAERGVADSVGPTFTCRRLGHFGSPRVGPSYLLEGKGPDQEEVAADAVH